MALIEETLFGTVDKVQIAIDRLKAFEPADGYWLAFSGGKDSVVIKRLAQMAFWRGWYEMEFVKLTVLYNGNLVFERKDGCVCVIENYAAVMIKLQLSIGDVIDLAELLGKDGAE